MVGTQIVVAILQATIAYHYHDDYREKLANYASKVPHLAHKFKPEDSGQQKVGVFATLQRYFNKKTKVYLSILEKSTKGILELAKALSEIGEMD